MCPKFIPNNLVSISDQSSYIEKFGGDSPQSNKCAKVNPQLIYISKMIRMPS